MIRVLVYILFTVFMFIPQFAGAQDRSRPVLDYIEDSRSYIHNPEYQYMVEQAFKHQPKKFNFAHFRRHYSGTSWYDPVADRLREEMLSYAYKILHSENLVEIKESREKYKRIVSDHLANVGVVMEAQALARQDKRLGDPEFFKWVSDGLMEVVLGIGDGKSLSSAYQVYTIDEEVLLMNHLNFKVIKTDSRHVRRTYYNMHLVEMPGGKEQFTIFVDVSRPFAEIERDAKKKNPHVDFLRQ